MKLKFKSIALIFSIAIFSPAGKIQASDSFSSDQYNLNNPVALEDDRYIETEMEVTPLNGSLSMFPGLISVIWRGTTLKTGNVDSSKVTATLNGSSLNMRNAKMSVTVKQETDEQHGGTNIWDVSVLDLNFTSLLNNKYGKIEITVKEGAVTSTDGKINREFTLTYYQYEIDGYMKFIPYGGLFEEGTGEIRMQWPNASKVTINMETPAPAFVDYMNLEGVVEKKTSVRDLMKEDEGDIVLDLSSLSPGSYSLTLPEGCILLEENGKTMMNGENYCDFIIDPAPKDPDEEEGDNPGNEDDPNDGDDDDNGSDNNGSDDPENPENPGNSDIPDNPDTPDTPDHPDNPDNPDNPDTPDNPDSSGVADILTDSQGVYSVYDLQGKLILTTRNGADLKTLAPGIYIVNGKKIVL